MKPLIIIIFLFIISLSYSQSKDCLKFRNGNYKMTNERTGLNLISRTDSIQIEHLPQFDIKISLNVEWINDCTMKLTLNKIMDNPNKRPVGDFVLISEITETKTDSYIMKSQIEGTDIVLIDEFFKTE